MSTFCAESSSAAISRKGFLLFGPGDAVGFGAIALVGLAGKTERTGVFGVVPEFLARKGFVSELEDADLGMLRVGVGSSNGETSATVESTAVIKTRGANSVMA